MGLVISVHVQVHVGMFRCMLRERQYASPTAHTLLRIAMGPKLLMRVWTGFLEKQQPKFANDPTDDPP